MIDLVNVEFEGKSSFRKYLYNVKVSLILDPVINFTLTVFVGFLVNLFPMISLVLIYWKVSLLTLTIQYHYDTSQWSSALIPVIILLLIGILTVTLLLYHMLTDFLRGRNITWYLDSIALLLQSLICLICVLSFAFKLFCYINATVGLDTQGGVTAWKSFTPLFVLAGLMFIKVVFFRVGKPFLILTMAGCIVATACTFEYYL